MPHKRHRQVYLCRFETTLVYIDPGQPGVRLSQKFKKGEKERERYIHWSQECILEAQSHLQRVKHMQWHSPKFHFDGLRSRNTSIIIDESWYYKL